MLFSIYFFVKSQIIIKVRMAFVFGIQIHILIDFTKIYQLKGLKPKNKRPMNFYECCDLMKKYMCIPKLSSLKKNYTHPLFKYPL